MNTKKILREALLKKSKREYDYGCVMINLNLDTKEWNKIQEMVDDDDIYNGLDGEGYGRELDPHITILFGIHTDVPDKDVKTLIDMIERPDVELDKITSFNNDQFDVLKFDIKSDDLNDLNEMFKELPHTNAYPEYHPHATICYLKPGLAQKYVKKLKDVEPIHVEPDMIIYSKSNGTKKNYPIK